MSTLRILGPGSFWGGSPTTQRGAFREARKLAWGRRQTDGLDSGFGAPLALASRGPGRGKRLGIFSVPSMCAIMASLWRTVRSSPGSIEIVRFGSLWVA